MFRFLMTLFKPYRSSKAVVSSRKPCEHDCAQETASQPGAASAGPVDWRNPRNWHSGKVPVAGDVIKFGAAGLELMPALEKIEDLTIFHDHMQAILTRPAWTRFANHSSART